MVKFIESAGGRVVPIWIGQNYWYYENIMSKINGVLWPDGVSGLATANGYADAAYKIYKIAKKMNDNGAHFPIFGISLGFKLLTFITSDRRLGLESCYSENQQVPLEFKQGYTYSKLFGNATRDVLGILATRNVTVNYHRYCVTEKALRTVGANYNFRVLSLNYDLNGVEFISSLESVNYPFYGLQFHPEKNAYEWKRGRNIPHTKEAVLTTQYFANFFVGEARRNKNQFEPVEEEYSLIYNYPINYTALDGVTFTQCYLFKVDQRKRG